MTETEFTAFLERSIPEYADEKVKAGNWAAEESLQKSRESHAKLLPHGLSTPDNYLFTIEHDGKTVGNLWLAIQHRPDGPIGFVYDVYIAEPFRRRGIAANAMRLLEEEAPRLGLHSLALHVFGDNAAARALYEKLGYEITNVNMSKNLPRRGME